MTKVNGRGVQYRILLLCPSFKEKGGVVFFCKKLMQIAAQKYNIKHFSIGNIVGNKNIFLRLLNFARGYQRLLKILNNQNFDLIHLNPSFKRFALIRDSVYLKLAIKHGFSGKTVVFFHGWNTGLAKMISRCFILKRMFSRIYNNAGIIFVLGNSFKKQLIKMNINPDKIIVTSTFYVDSGNYKWSFGGEKSKIHFLFMSRLVKNKGAFISAEVGRLLVEDGIVDFKMTIAGDGPEYKSLKKYINRQGLNNYITTPGYVEGQKKRELLEDSDILLFPTYYNEGCPIVILEAMGVGLAVVSTPVGAIPDIIEDNKNGFIISNKDPRDFYAAILKLKNDKVFLKKVQERNKKKALENFESKIVCKHITSVYESILNK